MKKVLLLAACGLLYGQADAQTVKKQTKTTSSVRKQPATDAKKAAAWPQLEAFHKVMAETYHPAEKGNFKPIRQRAQDLQKAMNELIGNPFPEAYRSSDMKVLVAHLEERVAVVNKMVEAKADDKELMVSLEQAHDVFHKIAGLCQKDHHE